MKTTIDIADNLLEEARRLASDERTTLRSLVEQGLRTVISERRARTVFALRDASFNGRGLQPGIDEASWEALRSMAYGDRGG